MKLSMALFGAATFLFIGCAPTVKIQSVKDNPTNLKLNKTVIALYGHERGRSVIEKMEKSLVDSLNNHEVIGVLYKDVGLTLDDKPLLTFARGNGSNSILVFQLKEMKYWNQALSEIESSALIYKSDDGKLIWKASINALSRSPGPGVEAGFSRNVVDLIMKKLSEDGLLK